MSDVTSRLRTYDKKVYNETLVREAKVRAEYDEVTARLREMNEKRRLHLEEGKAPDGFGEQYMAFHLEQGMYARELEQLRGDLSHLDRLRPQNRLPDPLALRTHDGHRMAAYLGSGFGENKELSKDAQEAAEASMEEFNELHGQNREAWGRALWPHEKGLFLKQTPVTNPVAPNYEQLGLVAGDASTGQESIPTQYSSLLVNRLKAFGGPGNFVRTRVTGNGQPIRVMRIDPTSEVGAMLTAQGSLVGEQDAPDIDVTTLMAHTFTSKFIPVTYEFEQDTILQNSGMTYYQDLCLSRIARLKNQYVTITPTGAGVPVGASDKPQGVITGAKEALTTAASGTFGTDDLIDLMFSIDPAYLDFANLQEDEDYGFNALSNGGRIGFMLSHDALKTVMKLKDSQGNPIWLQSIRDGRPGTILGYPYRVNHFMDSLADNTHPVAFGNFNYYEERIVNGMLFFRFMDSGTMANFSEKIVAFARADGRYIGALDGSECEAVQKLKIKPV